MQRAAAAMLPDGKRLHLQHGPIDLVIGADGSQAATASAFAAARSRFASVLDELVAELPTLRREIPEHGLYLRGAIARRMAKAVQPYWCMRVTPMAAVAGCVADEILRSMLDASDLARAYVNNGGDIALHLTGRETFTVASPAGNIVIQSGDGIGGVATSGWRGRSFSLGIADAVTVLATTAPAADVAATLIANAVNLHDSPHVKRASASSLSPDSDLGDRMVTVDVDALCENETTRALDNGERYARNLVIPGAINSAALLLQGRVRTVGRRNHEMVTEKMHA